MSSCSEGETRAIVENHSNQVESQTRECVSDSLGLAIIFDNVSQFLNCSTRLSREGSRCGCCDRGRGKDRRELGGCDTERHHGEVLCDTFL